MVYGPGRYHVPGPHSFPPEEAGGEVGRVVGRVVGVVGRMVGVVVVPVVGRIVGRVVGEAVVVEGVEVEVTDSCRKSRLQLSTAV